jgi:hypothetical protein
MHEFGTKLTSKAGLEAITSYKVNGEQLFFPPRGEPIPNEGAASLDFSPADSNRIVH